MKKHRMSSLPIAQFCGPGAVLGQVSSGRAAAQSTAFHATCSKAPDHLAKLRLLTDEEIAEVMQWKRPAQIQLSEGGPLLRYEDAVHELEVGLDKDGGYVAGDDPRCVSLGHLDMAWVHDVNGHRIAYIGDIKRSSWTTLDGPDSLQLIAYGFAFAQFMKCDYFVCGIWAAIEGEWTWGDLVDLESERASLLLARVVAAIHNVGTEYNTGAHCSGCYGALKCPAYLMPPEVAETSLAPFTSGTEITPDNALAVLLLVERVSKTAEAVKERLKLYSGQGGVIKDPATGKRWAPVKMPGREGIDYEAAAAAGIDIPKKRGAAYSQHRWLKT